jgi:hypothetical protein
MSTRTALFSTAITASGPVLALPILLAAQYDDVRTISLETYLDLERVSNPQISPDGRQLLYTRGWVDQDERPSPVVDLDRERRRIEGPLPRRRFGIDLVPRRDAHCLHGVR